MMTVERRMLWSAGCLIGSALLVGSLAGTTAAVGNDLPAALVYIHANELRIDRPGAADSIVIGDRGWAQPMTPVFVGDGAETVLFAAHPVLRFDGRDFVDIEIANLYLAGPGGVRQLTDFDGFTAAADCSPSGREIVFVYKNRFRPRRDRPRPRRLPEAEPSMQLYLQETFSETASLQVRCLTQTAGNKFNPKWSPDGERVAFGWMEGDTLGVYVLEVNTGRTVKVASRGDFPTWRPDGGAIAFTRNGRLFVVAVNDSGAVGADQPLLPEFRGYCSFLRWTASGLLFQWAHAREQGVSLYTPRDGQVRVLVSGAGDYGASDLARHVDK
jgi:hypothetical protein